MAGMPDGATASLGDVAPDQSPVLVPDLDLRAGLRLSFSVTGGVAYGAEVPLSHPDGHVLTLHYPAPGNENGIGIVHTDDQGIRAEFGKPLRLVAQSTSCVEYYLLASQVIPEFGFIGETV